MERRCSIAGTVLIPLLLWVLLTATDGLAQDARSILFKEADQAMEQAQSAQADLFSPDNFETAMKNYQQADENYEKGKSLEDIQDKLKMAAVYFLKAVETTESFKSNFVQCVSARNDALAAEALQFREEEFEEAESDLLEAAKTLEKGNLDGARSKADKAEERYRQVELEAIKANYLDETQAILEEREKELNKQAPLTLKKAQDLIVQAENLLIENRYDTDEARQLAQEAKYEAQHGIYLAQLIAGMKEQDVTVEEILLNAEVPIQRIASTFDLNARFNKGYDPPTESIIEDIQELKKTVSSLEQDINDREEQLAALSNQILRMESQLGDLQTKEATLTQIMEQQEKARQMFAQVEETFTAEEAEILRIGDQVIVRLYGLSFPVGESTIESQYFELLSKVAKSIDIYPDCGITIEGHTDSWGGDAANQKLSTERAEAVLQYLMATAGIEQSRLLAVGYGETKPVASNETSEGRRKNRRIDVVIHPKE